MNSRPGFRSSSRRSRPRLEQLEDRLVLACASVDPGVCTPINGHEGLAMHIHPNLSLQVNGQNQEIPANIGILADGRMLPLHTHDATGKLHVESPTQRDFRLKNFFEVWEKPLSREQVGDFRGVVIMIVDGRPSTEYGELVLRDGQNIELRVISTPATKPGTIQFGTPSYTVAANAGSVSFLVTRTDGSDGSVRANYASTDGTARAGVDYVAASGELVFAAGETSKTFTVSILNSSAGENRTATLTLSNPTGGVTLGSPTTVTLTITPVRPPADPVLNRNYVGQVYRDFYKREADAAGLASWAGALDNGGTPTNFLLGLSDTQEYYTQFVTQLYQKLLGRAPDAPGLSGFTSYLNAGGTLEAVRAVICGSDEYYQKTGGNNNGYLENMFRHLLDRDIDVAGRAGFTAALALGRTTRTEVAQTICASKEYREKLARALYQEYLSRIPDPGGLSYWVDEALGRGVREQHVRVGFLTSGEYVARYARRT